jgi:hypothetical protein
MGAEWSRQAETPTSPKVLEQRLSVRIHRILAELPQSSKLVVGGIYRAMGELHRLGQGGNLPSGRHPT